jgi:valyl-tRNA synthetase
MLGDTAVAVHPLPAKALDKAEAELRERLEKAAAKEKEPIQAQIDNIRERRKTMLPQLELLAKMARDGRKLMLPLVDREIPLIADEWAKPEMGSGCVKITPAHDPNDYMVGQRQKLPMINILNPDGTLNAEAGAYKGLTIPKAREKVVADLDALGLLGDVEDRDIELPHSDRSKTPIEPYLADQWFVKMSDVAEGDQGPGAGGQGAKPGLAQMAMDAVTSGRVKILPERYAKSYLDWLGEKRDWPVSRQLWWGHRIPVWSKPFHGRAERGETERSAKALWAPNDKPDEKVDFYMQWDPDTFDGTAFLCLLDDETERIQRVERAGYKQDPDVLDTWFSSALWPHSTFGWPEKTAALQYWYPTSVLITSRDIITLWVARMVLTGLNNMGEVPFREVFIHPKILDGYGETMSKSKGNGVDPIDVIDKFGADALRYGLAGLCTETQDVRMPVQFECPHCDALIDQTKKNRELPRIACSKCGKEFSTQWARTEADKALPRGAVVSERFEVSRNFTNKLWNAARFALINLQGYTPDAINESDLTVEDLWLLSRLATVTGETTTALEHYHYADAAKTLYDFAWDEFCSFYIEMAKPRLADATQKPHSQRLLAHALDVLLRLLHPMMPFITEDIWQYLGKLAPARGLAAKPQPAAPQLIHAPWPAADLKRQDKTIESQFAIFQQALAALREIRSRQNIANRNELEFCVKCDAATAKLLQPMVPYFQSMANAKATGWGEAIEPPATHAKASLGSIELYVDLKDFIDVKAEIAKNEKEEQRLTGLVKSKEAKLASENFVSRAPANVVQAERDSLAQAKEQLASVQASLATLRKS